MQVRVLLPAPIRKAPLWGAFLIGKEDRTRTHFYASVRWTLAATSSKTGGYIYFLSPQRGKKMQIESCCPLCEAKCKRVLLPAFAKQNVSGFCCPLLRSKSPNRRFCRFGDYFLFSCNECVLCVVYINRGVCGSQELSCGKHNHISQNT